VRRSDPETAREILVATKLAGRAHDLGVRVASGVIGGVAPGGFRGGLDLDDCSWGWNGWSRWSWSCRSPFWGSSCWWWSFPCYWSWYYPLAWWYWRPYYYADYSYYPVTSVVYTQPQVIYLEGGSEPVGEAVVSAPPADSGAPSSPSAAPSPLSIAAQRYLELGDRAFREGRYTDAVQFYAKAVEFAPDQGALYLVLSDALFAAGDYHYGAYAVRRALELDPALVESRVDKHGFYPDPVQFDEQLATLERYLGEHPGDRDARLVLALNYLFGGRAPDAVRVLEVGDAAAMADDPAAQRILARARVALQR
jgi:tetratricopeptide (TPR) repeat protein